MILIIDDDHAIRTSLTLMLNRAGYETTALASPDEALAWVRHSQPDLVLLDMNFSLGITGREGIELLQRLRIFIPGVPVILITAWGSIQLAVEGMRAGAADFITKPWNNRQLLEVIGTALQLAKPSENYAGGGARAELDKKYHFDNIIGASEPMVHVLNLVARVAPTHAPVLITGESGTGKELVAQAIHANSKRAGQPFVKVNLGGMSQTLFESEMFGHRKGAFTDAFTDRKGRFEMADKGTIFLDEIGDLDMSSQVKLLRVLQDQTFEPLGDSRSRTVDVRVICATHKNLPELIEKGLFREDLYYRINLISIHLPSLRERRTDIPVLAASFISSLIREGTVPPVTLSPEAGEWLSRQDFFGNVRELRNLVERTAILVNGTVLLPEHFETHANRRDPSLPATPGKSLLPLDEAEKQAILKAIEAYPNNMARVARTLGISRGALYRRLEKYDIAHESKN